MLVPDNRLSNGNLVFVDSLMEYRIKSAIKCSQCTEIHYEIYIPAGNGQVGKAFVTTTISCTNSIDAYIKLVTNLSLLINFIIDKIHVTAKSAVYKYQTSQSGWRSGSISHSAGFRSADRALLQNRVKTSSEILR